MPVVNLAVGSFHTRNGLGLMPELTLLKWLHADAAEIVKTLH